MLGFRVPTILPDMNFEESLETTKIHSVMGLIPAESSLIVTRPFRNPHQRQPLEEERVTISRAATSLTYPARFMLVAAMNPCPCGY